MDCETLREATSGCRVVIVTATEGEAGPLREELRWPVTHVLATKTLLVGDLRPERSLPGADGTRPVRAALAISGCDKANAAHVVTCLLQAMRPGPSLVLQIGIAGAFPPSGDGTGPQVGDIIVATEETYADAGSSSPEGWLPAVELGLPIACVQGVELGGVFPVDARLVRVSVDAIEEADWWEGIARFGSSPRVFPGPCVTSSRVTGLRAEGEAVANRCGALAESMEGAAAAHICALYEVPFLEIRGVSNLVVDRNREAWEIDRAAWVAARAARIAVTALALGDFEGLKA